MKQTVTLICLLLAVSSCLGERMLPNPSYSSVEPLYNSDERPSLDVLSESLCYAYLAYYPEAILEGHSTWRCEYQGGYKVLAINKTQSICPENTFVEIANDWIRIVRNDTESLFGYVSYSLRKRTVVVSFRGTDKYSLKNWMENFSALKTPPYSHFPTIEVHRGFYHAFDSVRFAVWDAMKEALEECSSCDRVHFVGHSLGGAIATVAMGEAIIEGFRELYGNVTHLHTNRMSNPSQLRKRHIQNGFTVELHTFGQPRVGNSAFTRIFRNYTVWRIVNDQDAIPHLPPTYSGYRHIPTELWENNAVMANKTCQRRVLSQCNGTGEDSDCSDSYKLPHSLSDHYTYMGMESPYLSARPNEARSSLHWYTSMPINRRIRFL